MVSWDVVTRAQTGDSAAVTELYEQYVDVVFRFVMSRLPGDRHTAEDLTSEVFCRALRRLHTIQNQGRDPGAWLIVIARNLVFDHCKSLRYKLDVPWCDPGSAVETLVEQPFLSGAMTRRRMRNQFLHVPEPRDPAIIADTGHAVAVVLTAVGRLPRDQRECVTLRFLAGWSVTETATVLGRSVGAVKALQHRAVRALAGMPEVKALRGV